MKTQAAVVMENSGGQPLVVPSLDPEATKELGIDWIEDAESDTWTFSDGSQLRHELNSNNWSLLEKSLAQTLLDSHTHEELQQLWSIPHEACRLFGIKRTPEGWLFPDGSRLWLSNSVWRSADPGSPDYALFNQKDTE